MKRVTHIDPSSYGAHPLNVTLECGHERSDILTSGGVSLEDLDTEAGRRLFPIPRQTALTLWRQAGRGVQATPLTPPVTPHPDDDGPDDPTN